jgi:hypothetical protein
VDQRTAKRLGKRIEHEDARVNITGYRRWPRADSHGNEHGARWEIDCTDTRSGLTFVVASPEAWDERRDDAANLREVEAYIASSLVAAADIAALAGVTVDAVHQWAKRHPAFRALAFRTSAGLIWRREDAIEWLRSTGRHVS